MMRNATQIGFKESREGESVILGSLRRALDSPLLECGLRGSAGCVHLSAR